MSSPVLRALLLPYSGIGRLPAQARTLLLIGGFAGTACATYSFLAIALRDGAGHDLQRVGILVGLWGIGSVLGALAAGWVLDRFRWRTALVTFLAVGSSLYIASGLVGYESLAIAAALLTLQGAARGAVAVSIEVGLTELCAHELRQIAYSVGRLLANVAVALGAFVGGWLISVNYRLAPAFDAIPLAVAAIAVSALLHSSMRQASDTVTATSSAEAVSPLRNSYILLLFAGCFFVASLYFAKSSVFQLHAVENVGIALTQYRYFFLGEAVAILLLEIPISSALSRRDIREAVVLGATFLTAAYAVLALYPVSEAAVVVAFGALCLGTMITFPALTKVIASLAGPRRSAGRLFGVYQAIFSASAIVTPMLFVPMVGVESGVPAWWLLAVVGVIGVAALAVACGSPGSRHLPVR